MPKLLFARPPVDAVEEHRIRKLAGARHAPADWIRRAQIIAMSWGGARGPTIAAALVVVEPVAPVDHHGASLCGAVELVPGQRLHSRLEKNASAAVLSKQEPDP